MATEQTPEPKAARKRQPVTLEQITKAWEAFERAGTEEAISLGMLVQRYIKNKLKGVKAAADRRAARAGALKEIGEEIEKTGRKATNLNRVVAIAATASVFGTAEAKTLSWRTVDQFSRLLKRDRMTEAWFIIADIEDEAKDLWASAAQFPVSSKEVRVAVDGLLAKVKPPKTVKMPVDKTTTAIERLEKSLTSPVLYSKLAERATEDDLVNFVQALKPEAVAALRDVISELSRKAA